MNVLTEVVRKEADKYTDWHIDLKKPMASSIVFLSTGSTENSHSESQPTKMPAILEGLLSVMCKVIEEEAAKGQKSFAIDVDDLRFRCTRMREQRYALRRLSSQVVPLADLNLGRAAMDIILDTECRSGLILIAGVTGAGKSTTAASAVVARLEKFGGYCLTAESPIEVDFEGFHGKGYVEQIDVSGCGYREEIASAMRKFPAESRSMFFFGEVIEAEGAAELVRLIGRGHLVVTTIHAATELAAIEMLVAFAERGGETYARQLIGANLLGVIHQKLSGGRPFVKCFRANEQIKNTISNQSVQLNSLTNAIDMARRTQLSGLRSGT